MALSAMNCFGQQMLYPRGGSAACFFHGQPASEPVDDYTTGVDICRNLLDRLHLLCMNHSDNAARFYSAAFITEMANLMPWLQSVDEADKMDETGDEDGADDVYIIDAEDEMDIVYEMDDTRFDDMGEVEAMDVVKLGDMDELGEMEMVIDS